MQNDPEIHLSHVELNGQFLISIYGTPIVCLSAEEIKALIAEGIIGEPKKLNQSPPASLPRLIPRA